MDVRVSEDPQSGRIDGHYIEKFVDWHLDQHRIKIDQRDPTLYRLDVRVVVKRILGPAQLEEGCRIEGLHFYSVEIRFAPGLRRSGASGLSLGESIYHRCETGHSESREEVEVRMMRTLETRLIEFANALRNSDSTAR